MLFFLNVKLVVSNNENKDKYIKERTDRMQINNIFCCPDGEKNTRLQRKIRIGEMTLAELPVGAAATIVKILPESRGRKKFADVGIVPGTELVLKARAPFGGLLRVKILETSMALHKSDARDIVLRER